MNPERRAEAASLTWAQIRNEPMNTRRLMDEALDALDEAERRAAEAEGDAALLKRWGEAQLADQGLGAYRERDAGPEWDEHNKAAQARADAAVACRDRARALALASVATGGLGGER